MHNRIAIATLLIFFCTAAHAQTKSSKQAGEIIYHVCQRSFYDSNGDRQGDLKGLIQQLPYLQQLGVTSILLLPLYDADCYHNYFANDFEKIDQEFGTMNDYILLVKEVHKRNMKLYMDMEVQYVTNKHLWWKDAVGNKKSAYSNFILFDDTAHLIPATMVADLRALNSYDGTVIPITTVNLRDKAVLEYNKKLFSFFVDPNKDGKFDDGVDGFRLDHTMDNLDGKPALTQLFEHFWQPLLAYLKKINPELSNVAEQSDWTDFGFSYFEQAGVDRMFGFGLQKAILSFNKQQLIENAAVILAQCPKGKEQIIFLENHDLDRFASLEKNIAKQKAAAALMLLIGGVPSIYYGQEIGMQGVGGGFGNTDGNDIPRREAFEWYKSVEGKGMAIWYKNTGPWWDKTNLKGDDGISLEEQLSDSNSLFHHYKQLIQIRQSKAALHKGAYAHVSNNNEKVFSFLRTYNNEQVLVAINLSAEEQELAFEQVFQKPVSLLGHGHFQHQTMRLNPYQVVAYVVK